MMPRPSLKTEKTEQILHAYERCVARYGVEGATLQKVAEATDMARPLLRHYVGNQADLLAQCLTRYTARQQAELTWFDDVDSVATLLDGLFDSTPISDEAPNDVMIASAFMLAAPQNPLIRTAMQKWFAQTQTAFTDTLTRLYPHGDSSAINVVSAGVIGIYFNYATMQSIENTLAFAKHSRQAAERLLAGLKPSTELTEQS